jgi:hypothetical protein
VMFEETNNSIVKDGLSTLRWSTRAATKQFKSKFARINAIHLTVPSSNSTSLQLVISLITIKNVVDISTPLRAYTPNGVKNGQKRQNFFWKQNHHKFCEYLHTHST